MKSILVAMMVLLIGCSSTDVAPQKETIVPSNISEIDALVKDIVANKVVEQVKVSYDSYDWSFNNKKPWTVRVELKTSCGAVGFKDEGRDIKEMLKTAKLKIACLTGADAISEGNKKK